MIKHIGKHNNKKIVLLWRRVPNEDHMALVVYSDMLPRMLHDEIMKQLESAVGQNAKELSDVLFRTTMQDGRNCLEVLHKSGLIKKAPTSQILITPTAKSTVRLDELNDILDEMEKGEEAIKRMADIDKDAGMSGKRRKTTEGREVGMPPNNASVSRTNIDVDANSSAAAYLKGTLAEAAAPVVAAPVADTADLATRLLNQAAASKLLRAELLAEAARIETEVTRLETEANELTPTKNVKTRAKKTPTTKKQAA